MGCFTHTRCTACGALRQAGSGTFLLMLRHPDFCGISVKYPRNRLFFVFFGLATTVVACATQLQIEVLFFDF